MAKIVQPTEAGLPEGSGLVRVSQGKKTRGKLLAVQHPIFGWMPFKQWALLRLVPEDRILPSIIVGVSTFVVAKLVMDRLGIVIEAIGFIEDIFTGEASLEAGVNIIENLPFVGDFFKGLIGAAAPGLGERAGPVWKTSPVPFYIATMAAGLTLAGLDPGMALRAFAELLNAIIPL